jgi:hypothetical protein
MYIRCIGHIYIYDIMFVLAEIKFFIFLLELLYTQWRRQILSLRAPSFLHLSLFLFSSSFPLSPSPPSPLPPMELLKPPCTPPKSAPVYTCYGSGAEPEMAFTPGWGCGHVLDYLNLSQILVIEI